MPHTQTSSLTYWETPARPASQQAQDRKFDVMIVDIGTDENLAGPAPEDGLPANLVRYGAGDFDFWDFDAD